MFLLFAIVCIVETDAWIHGTNKTIKYTDIHGTVKDSVTATCQYGPASISLKREELIYSYSDGDVAIVYIVRHGKYEILITTQQDWVPCGLCYTRSGNILVYMKKTMTLIKSMHKIVRYMG